MMYLQLSVVWLRSNLRFVPIFCCTFASDNILLEVRLLFQISETFLQWSIEMVSWQFLAQTAHRVSVCFSSRCLRYFFFIFLAWWQCSRMHKVRLVPTSLEAEAFKSKLINGSLNTSSTTITGKVVRLCRWLRLLCVVGLEIARTTSFPACRPCYFI